MYKRQYLNKVKEYEGKLKNPATNEDLYWRKEIIHSDVYKRQEQIYFKFKVGKDGVYKISYEDLIANAFPSTFNGSQLQVWRFGKEIPLFVLNNNNWAAGDHLLFFGEKNRSELDATLFSNPSKEMLNPEYSMYSDTAVYFITLTGNASSNKRINIKESNGTLPVADFFMTDQLHVYKEYPIDKKYDSGNEITYSAFDECEGFGTRPIQEHKLCLLYTSRCV